MIEPTQYRIRIGMFSAKIGLVINATKWSLLILYLSMVEYRNVFHITQKNEESVVTRFDDDQIEKMGSLLKCITESLLLISGIECNPGPNTTFYKGILNRFQFDFDMKEAKFYLSE